MTMCAILKYPLQGTTKLNMTRQSHTLRTAVHLLALLCLPAHAANVMQQANQAGITTCLPAIERAQIYLAGQQNIDAVGFWDNRAADKNMFSAIIELEGNNTHSIASLNVAPTSDGQCVVEYTQTGHVPQLCTEYLKNFNGLRYVRDMGQKTALFQLQNVHLLLTNTGKGCHWVRKEISKLPQAPKPTPTTRGSGNSTSPPKSTQPKTSR